MLRVASTNQVKEQNANIYLVGNPQITFFKSVFKRHTNFAIESFNITPRTNNNIKKTNSIPIIFEIPKLADLLGKIYLKLKIPPMKSDQKTKFKFNNHLGYQIIDTITLKINDTIVDKITGETLYIMNKLRNVDEKKKWYLH